jgi:short-subunit dehydrogenase
MGMREQSKNRPLAELRRQFDVNVFGAVGIIKAVLPFMRQRRMGHIINITSMGGYITMPGIAYYCGSKSALEAISETLSKEVKDHLRAVPTNLTRVETFPGAACLRRFPVMLALRQIRGVV